MALPTVATATSVVTSRTRVNVGVPDVPRESAHAPMPSSSRLAARKPRLIEIDPFAHRFESEVDEADDQDGRGPVRPRRDEQRGERHAPRRPDRRHLDAGNEQQIPEPVSHGVGGTGERQPQHGASAGGKCGRRCHAILGPTGDDRGRREASTETVD